MKSILMKEDLWNPVDDIVVQSGSSLGGKGKSEGTKSPQSSQLIPSEKDKLRKKRLRAKSIIEVFVELDLRIHIEDENDPRVAWKSLLALFQTNTIVDTLLILNKWELLRREDQINIATFFIRV